MKKHPLPPKTGHGGPRTPGPGKKLGRKSPGKGRTFIPKSVAMPAEAWTAFDAMRGTMARGAFISKRLKLTKNGPIQP